MMLCWMRRGSRPSEPVQRAVPYMDPAPSERRLWPVAVVVAGVLTDLVVRVIARDHLTGCGDLGKFGHALLYSGRGQTGRVWITVPAR